MAKKEDLYKSQEMNPGEECRGGFDFNMIEESDTLNQEILSHVIHRCTDAIVIEGVDSHDFLKSKGCFCATKGFYLSDEPHWENSYSGEYYIANPKYYLEKELSKKSSVRIPEVTNFGIVYLEPDRQDISQPVASLYISERDLNLPCLVFQQLIGEIRLDGVFESSNPEDNQICYVFLGIYKIEEANDDSKEKKYRFIKIGDTFYFDSSKKY